MPEKQKKKTGGGGLYISLAICIFLIVSIGIYTTLTNLFTPDPPASVNNTSDSELQLLPEFSSILDATTNPKNVAKDDKELTEDTKVKEPEKTTENAPPEPEIKQKTFVKPTAGQLTKEYSYDNLVFSNTMNDYRTHKAVDFAGNAGDAVVSFCDGKIESIYDDPLMGNTVVVDHGDGLKSVYANLSDIIPEGIEAGARVNAGSIIGSVGTSALIEVGDGPHLHFEVINNDIYENPMDYLS